MVKIAALQLNLLVGDLQGNCHKIEQAVKQATQMGAQVCLTTELAVCGYPPKDLLLYHDFADCCLLAVEDLAQKLKEYPPVIIGCPLSNQNLNGKQLFNGAVLIKNGMVNKTFGKALLPTYDVFDENRYFEPWNGICCFEHEGITFGVTICEDIWNDPEFIPRQLYQSDPLQKAASQGAKIILNLSASPLSIGKQSFREKMIGGLAKKHGVHIVYANQVGGNDDLVFDGRSVGFSPSGRCIARAKGFEEEIICIDLESESNNTITRDVECQEEEIWKSLVMATRDYAYKCGFKTAVLGLSGGIDSALTAAVAAEAFGPQKIMALLMPSPHSSRGSIDDSLQLAKTLGIRTEVVPIENIMESFQSSLSPLFAGCKQDITEENIQSRIRGNILMAISNKFNHLLLTTGNKSELAVGYCTIYGDMSGGFAVLSDLPKTKVYSVSKWMNHSRQKEVIPRAIIEKQPSAELRPDQTDQDSLPPYDILDDILESIIVKKSSPHKLNQNTLEMQKYYVGRLLHRAEFKRKQSPPGPKIFASAFGSGWRMPIAAKWFSTFDESS